ncbi:hypothetical protein K438DRAFT_1876731 [Mycena galopus ATCC 62051]|nr:hypothetical protein K438DRAFT_1876731 [Mycena galopus ATCC 62051]
MRIRLVFSALSVAYALAQSSVNSDAYESSDSELSSSLPSSSAPIFPASAASPSVLSPSSPPAFTSSSTTHGFPPSSGSHTAFATSEAFAPSGIAFSSSTGSVSNRSNGPIIAAAVGGSIAASLVVLAGVLFCMRARFNGKTHHTPTVAAENAEEIAQRCTALEREVSMLRERLGRLEARRDSGPRAMMLYTNEKDGEALDGKVAKDHPPTYVD